jgi:hypothetical protein
VLHQAVNTSDQTEGTTDPAEAGLREPMDDIDLAEKNEEEANDDTDIDSSSDDGSIDGVTPEELEAHEAKRLKGFALDHPLPEREILGLINYALEHYQSHVVDEKLSRDAEEKPSAVVFTF